MNYKEFKKELEDTLKKLRPAGYQIQRMKDRQGEDRLTVQKNGSFELNYRMESLYEDYRCGRSIKAVAKELIHVAEHNVKIRVAKKEDEVIVVTIKDGKEELKFPSKRTRK